MNWLSIKTWEYKRQAKECWHYWFAWYPVIVERYPDGAVEKAWLKRVKRKGRYELLGFVECGWVYSYKEI